jgi:phosphatidylglycerol:prolipoprotein diacylglycerol transferase
MHPILFDLGWFPPLRTYGLMMALGFLMGIALAVALNRREKRPDEVILDLSVWIMFGSIFGARVLYVVVEPEQFQGAPWWEAFAVWHGGLVYYGGLIGAGLTAYVWLRQYRQPVWMVADCLAPALALGQVFGRIGCFFNGCCYGRVDAAHGVIFPNLGDNLPRLPVQLYEAAFVLLLSAFLTWFKPRRSYPGQVFMLYIALYSVGRFILETQRGDIERGTLISPLLSPGQWISLVGLLFALGFHLLHRRRPA